MFFFNYFLVSRAVSWVCKKYSIKYPQKDNCRLRRKLPFLCLEKMKIREIFDKNIVFLGVFSKNFSFENLTKMLSFMGRKIYYLCFFYFHRIPLKNESEKHWLLCSFCVFKWFREGFRSWNTFEIFQYFHKIIENTPGNEDVFCWKSGNFRNISPKTFEIRCKNQISQKNVFYENHVSHSTEALLIKISCNIIENISTKVDRTSSCAV